MYTLTMHNINIKTNYTYSIFSELKILTTILCDKL